MRIYSRLTFAQVQPVLFRVMDHYQSNVAVMERCCRCIRFAIRVLGKKGVFALPSLAEKVRFALFSNEEFSRVRYTVIMFRIARRIIPSQRPQLFPLFGIDFSRRIW